MHKLKLLFLCLSVSLFSCNQDDSFKTGNNWVDPEYRLSLVDTISIDLSTKLLYEPPTDLADIFVGKYTDAAVGYTNAASYFKFMAPGRYDIPYTAVFDSLIFEMRYTGRYLGDTTQQEIELYRLTDILERVNGAHFTASTTFPKEASPIFTSKFICNPSNTIYTVNENWEIIPPQIFQMPNDFSIDLFEKIRDMNDTIIDQEKFDAYMKGFVMQAGPTSNCLMGIKSDSSFRLVLHFHDTIFENNNNKVQSYALPIFIDQSLHFDNIVTNRSGTNLANLVNLDDELRSDKTTNQAYIHPAGGLVAKIDFPYINNLNKLAEIVKVQKAILKLYPVNKYDSEYSPIPENIYLFKFTGYDEKTTPVSIVSEAIGMGQLIVDKQFGERTYYAFDVSNFLKQKLLGQASDQEYLYLEVPSLAYRLVIGDQSNYSNGDPHYKTELSVSLIMYNDKDLK